MTARVTHLLIEDRYLRRIGRIARCFVFDWRLIAPKDWEMDNERVREALKRAIPRDGWEWNAEEKRWYVGIEWEDALCAIFDRFSEDVKALEKQPTLFAAGGNEGLDTR